MKDEAIGRALVEALREVPDPRAGRGLRHPLPAVLALMVAGMLAGARSLYAIAQWGRAQDAPTVAALGFTRDQTPAVSTLHEVTRRIDPTALEGVLARWAQGDGARAGGGLAIDGKVLHGSHARGAAPSGWVDTVALYVHDAGRVLAQAGGKRGEGGGGTDSGTGLAGAGEPDRVGGDG
jgi:DDE family transposase